MASLRRLEKINMLLQEEVSKTLAREVELPEHIMVTITRVLTSSDGHYASVFISVIGNPTSTLEILRKNVYHIQQVLNRKVRIRPVPKIRFAIDEGEIQRENVEKSLARLKQKGEIY